jgi:glycosyltransferase involved in cell wall biosynthesis
VYPGVSARYALPSEAEVTGIRKKYSLPSKFFLFVGAWGRRKNLPRLIEAFLILLHQESGDLKLIMVGASSGSSEVEDRLRDPDIARHTSLLGFIPDEDMPPIYAACEALIFPSLGEGFGLPVIEAMACGTPVLLSRASCLPEVAGDAALYFDPEDPADIARAMSEFLHSDLSQDLRRRGLVRTRLFDWNNAALESERVYAEVLR